MEKNILFNSIDKIPKFSFDNKFLYFKYKDYLNKKYDNLIHLNEYKINFEEALLISEYILSKNSNFYFLPSERKAFIVKSTLNMLLNSSQNFSEYFTIFGMLDSLLRNSLLVNDRYNLKEKIQQHYKELYEYPDLTCTKTSLTYLYGYNFMNLINKQKNINYDKIDISNFEILSAEPSLSNQLSEFEQKNGIENAYKKFIFQKIRNAFAHGKCVIKLKKVGDEVKEILVLTDEYKNKKIQFYIEIDKFYEFCNQESLIYRMEYNKKNSKH